MPVKLSASNDLPILPDTKAPRAFVIKPELLNMVLLNNIGNTRDITLLLICVFSSNFKKLDTIAEFTVRWNNAIKADAIAKEQNKLERWLKQKYKLDTLVVRRN